MKPRLFGYLQAVIIFLLVYYMWFFELSFTVIQVDVLGDIVGVAGLILFAALRISTVSREFMQRALKKNDTSRILKVGMNSHRPKFFNQNVDFHHELTPEMME